MFEKTTGVSPRPVEGTYPDASADEIERLRKALADIEHADAKAMYERCPDCDYSDCSVTKRCKAMPLGPLGKLAAAALKPPNAAVTGGESEA